MTDSSPPQSTPSSPSMANGNGSAGETSVIDPTTGLPILPSSTQATLGDLSIRPKSSLWDRSKFLIGAIALWWVLVWAAVSNNPAQPFSITVSHEFTTLLWLEILAGIELVRQIHYFISEHSRHWHNVFANRFFGRIHKTTGKISDWNRYRIGRVIRVVVLLALADVILAGFTHTSPATSLYEVPSSIIGDLPSILQLGFYLVFGMAQFAAIFWFMSKGGVDTYYPGDVKTRFSDVWGQDAVLERVKESIIYLKDPEAIESKGGYVPGGILLWGPPGTGKTLLAEAVAGETENPFVFVDPGAFNAMFMGVGQLKVKSLFRKLRKLAIRYGGVVVFFDEADSLGNRGSLSGGGIFGRMTPAPSTPSAWSHDGCHGTSYLDPSATQHLAKWSMNSGAEEAPQFPRKNGAMMGMGGGGQGTLQSLLAEMSGLKKPRGFFNRVVRRALGVTPKNPPKYRIMVMMATNMPNSLDEALLRPGRLDRIYKVGYPSKAGRVRTYEGYFSKVANNLSAEDIDKLAIMTPYATGAIIKDLVNESLIHTIREGREIITWKDVVRAKQLKDLGPPEDVEYVERERHAVAIHEACHAVVAARVRQQTVIDIATIEKGGNYLGFVSNINIEDTFTSWRSDYEADIMVCLASLAGERMFFGGDNSSGVSGDLDSATAIATYMEGYWGMGDSIASHGMQQMFGVGGGTNQRNRGERDTFGRSLGGRIEGKLTEIFKRTAAVLAENRLEVLGVAYALETHKTITGDDVVAIVNGTQGPFIDGRRYRSDAFRDLVEAYHAQAYEAHKNHGKVNVPLPALPELVDAELVSAAAPMGNGVAASGAIIETNGVVHHDVAPATEVSGNGDNSTGTTEPTI